MGCGYKYLNGGPGAPAFAFVARRWHSALESPLSGWMGHADPFAFGPRYEPAPGVARLLCGTPPILSLAALECGVETVARAGIAQLRRKSVALTDLFVRLVEQECGGFGFTPASPREAERRGSQVSLRHPEGYAIVQALIARGVVGDFRTPDILRFGFAPAYVRFTDAWDAVAALREVMENHEWQRPEHQARGEVTRTRTSRRGGRVGRREDLPLSPRQIRRLRPQESPGNGRPSVPILFFSISLFSLPPS